MCGCQCTSCLPPSSPSSPGRQRPWIALNTSTCDHLAGHASVLDAGLSPTHTTCCDITHTSRVSPPPLAFQRWVATAQTDTLRASRSGYTSVTVSALHTPPPRRLTCCTGAGHSSHEGLQAKGCKSPPCTWVLRLLFPSGPTSLLASADANMVSMNSSHERRTVTSPLRRKTRPLAPPRLRRAPAPPPTSPPPRRRPSLQTPARLRPRQTANPAAAPYSLVNTAHPAQQAAQCSAALEA